MSKLETYKSLIIIGIFTVLLSFESYAQKTTIEQDSVEIEFVKNDKLKGKYPKTYIDILNGFRITVLEVDIKNLDLKKGEFDPNKFYLVSEKPKLQYRPLDIFIADDKNNYSRFELVTNTKPKETSKMQETYDPNIKDTYLDYKIDGVSGIKIPINLGSPEFPDKHVFHFKPKVINDSRILIYFYLTSDFIKSGTLYYGNDKITETKLK
ncbi:MAG: hypothetical protein HRU49_14325 [Winogradskyella sp.]|uniref:hypothetical protein n=1 Tax=Winogradskyella sp. TaxID=1883156 RepID=UPI0025CE777E|nr:hypothetical protein [Winogradskyella sp.]NRB84924.1 hypothetical protein [Winogradskyella sp.]